MLTQSARQRISRYLNFNNRFLMKWLRRTDHLLVNSESFLEPDDQNMERPFHSIIKGFNYLTSTKWNSFESNDQRLPSSVEMLRSKLTYSPDDQDFISSRAQVPLAAILFVCPSMSKHEHLSLIARYLKLLSMLRLLNSLKRPLYPATVNGFNRFLDYAVRELQKDQWVLPLSMKRDVERGLSIYIQYWENDQTMLTEPFNFSVESFFGIDPFVISKTPNCRKPIIDIRLSMEPGLTSQEIRNILSPYQLIFSGGKLSPFNIISEPMELHGDDEKSVYLINIKPENALDGRFVDPGPVNLITPDIHEVMSKYLVHLSSALSVTSNRFWLPWDDDMKNFLWVGKPELDFQIPAWLNVGPFTKEFPMNLYGAEQLEIYIDNAKDVELSGTVKKSHVVKQVALPLDMEKVINYDGTEGLYPRRYKVKYIAGNRYGSIEQQIETGVTYPVRLNVLAYDVGQTISTGLKSSYPVLNHQPAYGSRNLSGNKRVIPVNPPMVRGKGTWINILWEHNAPLPYFRQRSYGETGKNNLACTLDFEVRNTNTGQIEHQGQLSDSYIYDPRWAAKNEGVLDPDDDSKVTDADKVHEYMFKFGSAYFHFIPQQAGTYHVKCKAAFHHEVQNTYGIAPSEQKLDFYIQIKEPVKVKWHWAQILPEDNWQPVKKITDSEYDLLEEWLSIIVPSIEFEFHRGESIEYKPPRAHWGKSDRSRICDKMENLRGNRSGIFMGVMTKDFQSALDDSFDDIGGAARYSERIGFIIFYRYSPAGIASMLANACNAAHEFGHAHPHAYHHYSACNDPDDTVTPVNYWKPDMQTFYPSASCGEKIFFPLENRNQLPNWQSLFISPCEGIYQSRDIMTYCSSNFFELIKTVELHQNHTTLSGE